MFPNFIGVITPVGPHAENLARAIDSVRCQTFPAVLQIVVHDGTTPTELDSRVAHINLPMACSDTGATPRAIGANLALAQGCDALAFLDADNTWEPEHLMSLATVSTHHDVAIAQRRIVDDQDFVLCENDLESNGDDFTDTNCFLLTGRAVQVARLWGHVPRRPGVSTANVDRYLWKRIKQRDYSIGKSNQVTVIYRTRWLSHFRNHPDRCPEKCKVMTVIDGVLVAQWVQKSMIS